MKMRHHLAGALVVFPSKFHYLFTMIKVAVGIILQKGDSFDSGRVLLCQRMQTARYALKWEFPGGKIENNEPLEECLRRELHEELGITADVGTLFHHQHTVYPDSGSFDVFYYLVKNFSGEIVNRVFARWQWVALTELPEYDILEGNRDVVRRLVDHFGPR
jgi:8-oxo-dGTP diphosphatase